MAMVEFSKMFFFYLGVTSQAMVTSSMSSCSYRNCRDRYTRGHGRSFFIHVFISLSLLQFDAWERLIYLCCCFALVPLLLLSLETQ